jgi:deoxyribodipyrimidine photolyase-related protein
MRLCLVLGDQLSLSLPMIQQCQKNIDRIVLFEVMEEATYVKHHKKKLVLIFSAMRHFAQDLQAAGYQVSYVTLDDPRNTGSLTEEMRRAITYYSPEAICVTFPGEYRVREFFKQWLDKFAVSIEVFEDNRFVSQPTDFLLWANGRKQLRMEFFYRDMRKRTGLLMDKDKPIGGQWNYDQDNRKLLPADIYIPPPLVFFPDAITGDVMTMVDHYFPDNFGETTNFNYAVTTEQALAVFDHFIAQRLQYFGDYQDAMKQGDPWLFHSHISFYLNNGLLLPMEAAKKAEAAYYNQQAPLAAVEGFIRQIIGWREYVRGFYWMTMPSYKERNYLNASRPLPDFYWTAATKMNCVKQCVNDTQQYAYAHHIQRLMVLGNFALLAGIAPQDINDWYLLVYADAYEWVELPNVSGMVLFADGGLLASKPYIAGGAYIHKMSNYCDSCYYKVKKKTGENACPFNYLYWNFLLKHQDKLSQNPRLAMPYRTLKKMADENRQLIATDAEQFLARLSANEEV